MRHVIGKKVTLLAGFLAGSIAVSTGLAQSAQGKGNAAEKPSPPSSPAAPKLSPTPPPPPSIPTARMGGREGTTLRRRWGVDNLQVRGTSSGWLVRFSYRVVDLYDKKATPYLIDERSGRALQVPIMEKVGQLRQTTSYPENGREDWMAFSNKGRCVKPGNHVTVVIGGSRIEEFGSRVASESLKRVLGVLRPC